MDRIWADRAPWGMLERPRNPEVKAKASKRGSEVPAIQYEKARMAVRLELPIADDGQLERSKTGQNRSGQAPSIGAERGNEVPAATWRAESRPRNRNWHVQAMQPQWGR